jgi:hypothetical protein
MCQCSSVFDLLFEMGWVDVCLINLFCISFLDLLGWSMRVLGWLVDAGVVVVALCDRVGS